MGLEIDGVSGIIKNTTSDGDITIKGNDGGSEISALTFDISAAGAATFNNKIVATELDISGDVDVDGTTNLDIVDIDGAVNMATTLIVGGVITVIDGSTSAPSITNAGDTNSGIYFPADDNIGLVVGGSRKLLANSTGVSISNGTFAASGGAVFNEGSADVDFRVESNGNANMLFVDGGNDHVNIGTATDLGGVLNVSGTAVIQTADNTDTLTLKSTDADENIGPVLRAKRVSSSAADNDELFNLILTASNDAQEDTDYAKIKYLIKDASNGTEDAQIDMQVMQAGSLRSRMKSDNAETVFNEDSVDIDFRVESNDDANMLFVDGGNNAVGIATNSPVLASGRGLVVHGGSSIARVELRNDTSGAAATDGMFLTYSGNDAFVGNREAGTIQFWNNGSERMRITQDGSLCIGQTDDQGGTRFLVAYGEAADAAGHFRCTNGSFTNDGVLKVSANRSNTTGYELARFASNNEADPEFIFRGDGNAYADNNWNAGGADYAEYFEWKDGNSSSEDRRGYSVVLDDNKIVKATDSDDVSKIIGVISATPAVIGDADIRNWKSKYLKDDFGSYLRDEDGYRILNTDYDETKDYVPRENRKEWDTVGLMGKLRLKKGEPTGTNWIKMRDISDTVEEWLVR